MLHSAFLLIASVVAMVLIAHGIHPLTIMMSVVLVGMICLVGYAILEAVTALFTTNRY